MALASLIFGILAVLTVCNFLFIPSIIAIVTGIVARGQINRSAGMLTGSGLATAGIVLGILGALFLCGLNLAVFATNPDLIRALQGR
jgi:hypothetical protein